MRQTGEQTKHPERRGTTPYLAPRVRNVKRFDKGHGKRGGRAGGRSGR